VKKKIVEIFVCMLLLLLAIIPSTSIAKEIPIQGEPDYTFLLGTIVINEVENTTIHGFAIRLRFFELGETERSAGFITFRHVSIHSNMYYNIIKIIGKLFFIWGVAPGWVEIL